MKNVPYFEKKESLLLNFLHDEIKSMVKETLQEIAKTERDAFFDTILDKEKEEDPFVLHNRKNGYYERDLSTEWGILKNMKIPRDRLGDFRPFFVKRYDRNLFSMSELVIAMYQGGLSTRKVTKVIEELTEHKYSPAWVSHITQVCQETLDQWKRRKFRHYYPFIFVDAQYLKVRRGTVASEAVITALGIDWDGRKEVLGFLFPGAKESSNLYRELLHHLKSQGLKDPLCFIGDGLSGLEDVIRILFPRSDFQQCMVHQMRHTMLKVRRGERVLLANDLKEIVYSSSLDEFNKILLIKDSHWKSLYPRLFEGWKRNINSLTTYLKYPACIRKNIYTTNVLERLHKEVKRRTKVIEHFPKETSAETIVYLVYQECNDFYRHRQLTNWKYAIDELKQIRKLKFGVEELRAEVKISNYLKEVIA